MQRLPVFLACDEPFFPHLATAVRSLLENNKKAVFDIHVIHTGITPTSWAKLEKMVSQFSPTLLHSRLVDDHFLKGIKVSDFLKISTYYRLFIEQMTDADKVLYLDSDLIVLGDITHLYEVDLTDHYVLAVKNPGFKRHKSLHMKESSDYFNTGVLVINLDMWRKNNVFERVVKFVRENPKAILYMDQCGLNSIIDGQWKKLSPRYNMQSAFYGEKKDQFLEDYDREDMQDALKNPVIMHFTGIFKPWNFGTKHPYRKVYWYYRNQTPFKALFSDDFSMKRMISHYLPKSLKDKLKGK